MNKVTKYGLRLALNVNLGLFTVISWEKEVQREDARNDIVIDKKIIIINSILL